MRVTPGRIQLPSPIDAQQEWCCACWSCRHQVPRPASQGSDVGAEVGLQKAADGQRLETAGTVSGPSGPENRPEEGVCSLRLEANLHPWSSGSIVPKSSTSASTATTSMKSTNACANVVMSASQRRRARHGSARLRSGMTARHVPERPGWVACRCTRPGVEADPWVAAARGLTHPTHHRSGGPAPTAAGIAGDRLGLRF